MPDSPRLVIGVLDGDEEYQFSDISSVARQSDGDLVVADQGTRTVRLYGIDGGFRQMLGGPGSGPGEFLRPTQVLIDEADSIFVWDDTSYRLTRFNSAGAYVGDYSFDRARIAKATTPPLYPGSARLVSSGDLLVRLIEKSKGYTASGRFRAQSGLLRVDADMSTIDTVAYFSDVEQVMVESPWGRLPFQPPLARNTWITVQPNEARFCIGDQDDAEIICYDPDGTAITVSWGGVRATVSEDDPDLTQWRETTLALYELKLSAEDARSLLDQIPLPPERPPFSGIVLDREGNLWVEIGPSNEIGATEHLVFDRRGTVLGPVPVPRMQILDIGDDDLVAAFRDELDVQYLGVFDIGKPDIARRPGRR